MKILKLVCPECFKRMICLKLFKTGSRFSCEKCLIDCDFRSFGTKKKKKKINKIFSVIKCYSSSHIKFICYTDNYPKISYIESNNYKEKEVKYSYVINDDSSIKYLPPQQMIHYSFSLINEISNNKHIS